MSNSAEVAGAGSGDNSSSSLTDAQVDAFWAGVLANHDAARRMAGQYVSKHTIDDVVNTAAILFIESFSRKKKPAKYPENDEEFRRRFIAVVRNHSIDCVRDSRT